MKKAILFALLLVAASAAAETTAIVGATVHTVGPHGTIEGATIIMTDGRIAGVGKGITVPAGASVVDASGKVVTPGLFTPTGQLGLVEVGFSAGPLDAVQRGDENTASFDVSTAFNPRSTLIAINRIEGVTRSLIEPRAAGPDENGYTSSVISGLAAVVNLSGDAASVDASASAVVVNLGETGVALSGSSRVSAMLVLQNALDDAADYRDNRFAWERGQHPGFDLSEADLQVLQGVLSGQIPLLIHVDRASDIAALLNLKREYGVRLIISGGAEAWMLADDIAAASVPVLIAPEANLPSNFDSINARGDSATILSEAGVLVAFADGQSQTHNARNMTQSAGNATVAGLSWDDALRAITLNPAEIYGVDEYLGSLEAGKLADVVIWPGDPLELTNYPEAVYINGKAVEMTSRQTLLRDRYLDTASTTPPAYRN